MYVVRRPFKNYGQTMLPGSVVEPGSVKRFKNRLQERVIIEVSAHDFDKWNEYFKAKLGVSIVVPGETAGESTEGTAGENTEGTAGETTGETAGENTEGIVGENTEGTAGETTGETAGENTEGTAGENTEGTAGETPKAAPVVATIK